MKTSKMPVPSPISSPYYQTTSHSGAPHKAPADSSPGEPAKLTGGGGAQAKQPEAPAKDSILNDIPGMKNAERWAAKNPNATETGLALGGAAVGGALGALTGPLAETAVLGGGIAGGMMGAEAGAKMVKQGESLDTKENG